MRISDWSSDVCSSDLDSVGLPRGAASNQGHPSFPFVLSLSKHRPTLAALETRAALRQAQGERAFSPVALEGEKGEALNILLLAGDGIGPEIMAEAEKVLGALALPVTLDRALVGGAAYEATGHPRPPETLAKAKATDEIGRANV